MNKKTLFSISDVAKLCDVSRMTIHRYLASGQLRLHGNARRGRGARCMDLHECQSLIARQPYRAIASASVESKMLNWICQRRHFCRGADWRAVMSRMLAAAVLGDADADLLLYSARCLLRHKNDFLAGLLMDGKCKSTAACAGRAIVADSLDLLKLDDMTFRQAWRIFIRTVRAAHFFARPVLIYEPDLKRARLILSPRWVYKTPKYLLHDSSAGISAYQVKSQTRAIMDKISLRLASVQWGDNGEWSRMLRGVAGDVVTYMPDDMTLKTGRSTAYRKKIQAITVDLPASQLYGEARSAILAPDVRQDFDDITNSAVVPEWLQKLEALGLNKSECQKFARALRCMAGLPDARRWQTTKDIYGRDIELNLSNCAHGRQISISVMARALGVSRLTVRRWCDSARPPDDKTAAAHLLCKHCSAVITADAEECPECGRLL